MYILASGGVLLAMFLRIWSPCGERVDLQSQYIETRRSPPPMINVLRIAESSFSRRYIDLLINSLARLLRILKHVYKARQQSK